MDSQENSTRLSRSIGSNFLNYSKNGNRRKLLLGSQYLYITKTKQKHQKKPYKPNSLMNVIQKS